MTTVSVLTLVKNRETHLVQLVEGLRRSEMQPAELIVVDMSDKPVATLAADFPIIIHLLETDALPLAAARNRAARLAKAPHLVFLDVDCIPLAGCIGRLCETLDVEDALLCADIRYLGAEDTRTTWDDAALLVHGRKHPVRDFPTAGVRRETNPGLFWSLAFAIRRTRFEALGGFDEAFVGYGAEDTDFGYRADRADTPLLFVGGAIACHQHHDSFEPPVQHLDDVVRNAMLFHDRWGWWPMQGWLDAFATMGLITRHENGISIRRRPDPSDFHTARQR